MNPRKNIPRLLMAFNEFKKNTNNDLKNEYNELLTVIELKKIKTN